MPLTILLVQITCRSNAHFSWKYNNKTKQKIEFKISIFLSFNSLNNLYVKECTLINTKLSLEIISPGINYQSQIFRNEHRTVLLNAMNKACILSFRMQNLLNILELIDVFNL